MKTIKAAGEILAIQLFHDYSGTYLSETQPPMELEDSFPPLRHQLKQTMNSSGSLEFSQAGTLRWPGVINKAAWIHWKLSECCLSPCGPRLRPEREDH